MDIETAVPLLTDAALLGAKDAEVLIAVGSRGSSPVALRDIKVDQQHKFLMASLVFMLGFAQPINPRSTLRKAAQRGSGAHQWKNRNSADMLTCAPTKAGVDRVILEADWAFDRR